MAYTAQSTSLTTGIFSQFAGFIDTAITRYQQNQLIRQTYNELNALSDRELADLGLHRSNLKAVANEAVLHG